MRKLTYRVMPEDAGSKIKSILKQKLRISAAILTELKNTSGGILLNKAEVYATKEVEAGDLIEITLTDENSPNIVPSAMNLDILFEDEDLLVLNKPRNMPTHPSQNHHADTLANGVMHYFKDSSFTFRVITRLDKDTSGVVIVAKNKLSASILTESMNKGEIKKEYLAMCHGVPKEEKGEINAPIARKEGSTIERTVNKNGKPALTLYELWKENNNLSLIRVYPITGRTHQIRLHLSYTGNPIYGDDMYGSPVKNEYCRLHCRKITLPHPITGETMEFEASIPADMAI